MIHLYIDSHPIVLNKDVEISFYVYNPFFERKGDYTYDIDIDLNIKQNARVYHHLNRHNVVNQPLNRKAELFNDSICLFRGTEIILSIEDNVAKIQIVAGNSELNYLSAANKDRIQSLDMGSIPLLDSSIAGNSLYGTVETFDFVCTPVGKQYRTFPSEQGSDNYSSSQAFNALYRPDHERSGDFSLQFLSNTEFRAQPYLAAIVEKVVQAMGYTVLDNVLRSGRFAKVIIVNTADTLDYNKMIPNWYINDFLNAVEEWCNVVFLINRVTKECRIVNVEDYYQNIAETINMAPGVIIDGIDKEYSDDETEGVSYDNVSYNLPDSEWYDYGCLKQNVIDACEVIEFASYTSMVSANIDKAADYNKTRIYHCVAENSDFVLRRRKSGSSGQNWSYFFYPVKYLQAVVDEDSNNSVSFNIVPAPCIPIFIGGVIKNLDQNRTESLQFSGILPIAQDIVSVEETDSDEGLNEYITDGLKEESIPSTMFVAIYRGVQPTLWFSQYTEQQYPLTAAAVVYPMAVATPYVLASWSYNAADGQFQYIYPNVCPQNLSLAPSDLYNQIYSTNAKIDTTRLHKIHFVSEKIMDPRNIFVIHNLQLYCKYLLYKINMKGIQKEVEGVFYPVK